MLNQRSKKTIRLIVNVARVINADPDTKNYLALYFLPDYSVSIAEVLIPASDISQHISTAGTEASGTSNMKFCLNGGLLLGTVGEFYQTAIKGWRANE
jgi:glycogen phosphorylase